MTILVICQLQTLRLTSEQFEDLNLIPGDKQEDENPVEENEEAPYGKCRKPARVFFWIVFRSAPNTLVHVNVNTITFK